MTDSFFSISSNNTDLDLDDVFDKKPETDAVDDEIQETDDNDADDANSQENETQEEEAPKTKKSIFDNMSKEDIEKKALSIGWNPNGKKSAEEWVKNTNTKVFKDKEIIDSLQKKLDNIESLHLKQLENERVKTTLHFKNILKELNQKQREAVELSDNEALEDVLEQKQIIQQQIQDNERQNYAQQGQSNILPHVKEFIDNNPWYETDTLMQARFNNIVQSYISQGVNGKDALMGAKEDLERYYPDKMGVKAKQTTKPPTGDVLGVYGGEPKKQQSYNLNPVEQREVNEWVSIYKDMQPNASKQDIENYRTQIIKGIKR